MVLFPAPAGPSMATTKFRLGFSARRFLPHSSALLRPLLGCGCIKNRLPVAAVRPAAVSAGRLLRAAGRLLATRLALASGFTLLAVVQFRLLHAGADRLCHYDASRSCWACRRAGPVEREPLVACAGSVVAVALCHSWLAPARAVGRAQFGVRDEPWWASGRAVLMRPDVIVLRAGPCLCGSVLCSGLLVTSGRYRSVTVPACGLAVAKPDG